MVDVSLLLDFEFSRALVFLLYTSCLLVHPPSYALTLPFLKLGQNSPNHGYGFSGTYCFSTVPLNVVIRSRVILYNAYFSSGPVPTVYGTV